MKMDIPIVGARYKLLDHDLLCVLSPLVKVYRIIESGQILDYSEVQAYYNFETRHSESVYHRLKVFIRLRVVFWDQHYNRFRIFPWDEQMSRSLAKRLIPIVEPEQMEKGNPVIEPKPEQAAFDTEAALTTIKAMFPAWFKPAEHKAEKPTPSHVSWSDHAKLVAEVAALKATLKRALPTIKFDE